MSLTGIELRLPELSGGPEQQLRQIRSYLYSLAGQLQFAFDGMEKEQETVRAELRTAARTDAAENFSSIKSLIIRSAELTEAFAEKLEQRLQGKYVAQSQFGSFTQLTEQKIAASAEEVRQEFSNWQRIESAMEEIESSLQEIRASIRSGLLYETAEGIPVYGLEIGQQEWGDGIIRFRKFARLTADRLSFYDSNDVEVAYISDRALHVTHAAMAEIRAEKAEIGRMQMGDYLWQLGADGHLSLR